MSSGASFLLHLDGGCIYVHVNDANAEGLESVGRVAVVVVDEDLAVFEGEAGRVELVLFIVGDGVALEVLARGKGEVVTLPVCAVHAGKGLRGQPEPRGDLRISMLGHLRVLYHKAPSP